MEDGRRDREDIVQKPGALRIYDGALSEEFCDELISVFESKQSILIDGNNHHFNEYNYTSDYHEDEVHGNFMNHISMLYKHYLKDVGTENMINISGFEEVKIKRYDSGIGEHGIHIDTVDQKSSIRAVSFLFFLNETDGNIEFPLQRLGLEGKKGRVVIYPSTWEYPKNIHKSSEKDRYTAETYLHYA